MKKGKLILIVAILSLFLLMFFNIKSNPSKVERVSSSQIALVNQELEDFQSKLTQKDGLFDQVGKKLMKKGYEHTILGMIYSEDEILVKFVLTNKEANKKASNKVITIFNEIIIENEMDPKSFKVKVSNEDSPDW